MLKKLHLHLMDSLALKRTASSPILLIAMVPVLWSGTIVWSAWLLEGLPVFAVTFIRFVIAALVFLPVVLYSKAKIKNFCLPPFFLWPKLLFLGLAMFGYHVLTYIGLMHTTAINCTIISAFTPVLVAFFAALILKEEITSKQYQGFLLSIGGIVIVTIQGSWETIMSLAVNHGDLLIFMATAIWAFYSIIVKEIMKHISALEATTYATLMSILLLLPLVFWEWNSGVSFELTWGALAGLLYLGLLGSVVAFIWFNKGVSDLGPTLPANFLNLIPFYTVLLSVLTLGESVHTYHIIGGILIVLGVLLGSNFSLPRARPRIPQRGFNRAFETARL